MPYAVNPDRNIPWNSLPDLPIERNLFETVEIYRHLGEAKASLGKLQGRSIAIPNQGLLINSISLQEAKASSAIENIFTTDDELYQAFSEKNTEQTLGSAKEILRYREALWQGHNYLKDKTGFDLPYFVQIYRTVNNSSDSIRPPIANIYIRQGGSGPNAGKVSYTPPRGPGIIEAKMENLINFINNYPEIDPVIKMAIGHYQFEAIHPFRDGNGRTGRLFNIHYLTQTGLLDYPILFLSRYILDNKDAYYSGLAGVSQRGDWVSWIKYILTAIAVTANLTYFKINDIIAAQEDILKAIVAENKIQRPEKLVETIFTEPYTRVKHLTSAGIYAENTARRYLDNLVKMGILELRVIKGNNYYLNLELYRILGSR